MSDESTKQTLQYTHEDAETLMLESLDWPTYFVCGEDEDAEGFVPAYYRIGGPNGPVSYCNPGSGPHPTTMFEMALDADATDSFRKVERDETPWPKYDND